MIEVQVFAGLKDFFSPKFQVAPLHSVAQLKAALEAQQPASTVLLSLCKFAVNEKFVSLDHPLHSHDRVAILPPSSGG